MTRPSVHELQNELEAAALAIGPLELARLRRLGLCNRGVARMGLHHHPFGIAEIVEDGDGMFGFGGPGHRKLIVPVHEDGVLIDLVALATGSPDEWSLRTGAGLVLGLHGGWEPHRWRESVFIHANPLNWLAAGGEGLCVVNWTAPELFLLNDLNRLVVPDAGVAAALRRALARPIHLAPIEVMEVRDAA